MIACQYCGRENEDGAVKCRECEDVRRGVEIFRSVWKSADSRVLVSCDYGASRSPALAYVCVADQLGPNHVSEALSLIMKIRPGAVPNKLVTEFGDVVLERKGALLKPLNKFDRYLNEELKQ